MTDLLSSLHDRLATARAGRRRSRRGMTLMEVMIVIAIILLLMGVLTFGLASMFGEAQGDAAGLMIQRIDQKVKIFKVKKRKLPDSLEEIYKGEEVPKDPWGNAFVFRKSGGKDGYDIISYGADGKEGGDDDVKLSEQ